MKNKDFLKSKATWGAIFLLIAPLLQSFGLDINVEKTVETITQLIGGVLFIVGQFTRDSKINTVAGIQVTKP